MREAYYLMAMTYNMLEYAGQTNLRRDLSSTLFNIADVECRRKTSVFTSNLQLGTQTSDSYFGESNLQQQCWCFGKSNVFKVNSVNLDINAMLKKEKEKNRQFTE